MGFSLVAARGLFSSCGVWAPHCSGVSLIAEHRLSGMQASIVAALGLSGCASLALEQRLNHCGAWISLPHGMWDLSGSGIKFMSPALAGRFFTTEPPGKPSRIIFKIK